MARAYVYSYSRHYHTLHQHLNDVGRASVFYWSPFQRHGGWRRCILNKYIFFSFDCILISRFHVFLFLTFFQYYTLLCFMHDGRNLYYMYVFRYFFRIQIQPFSATQSTRYFITFYLL